MPESSSSSPLSSSSSVLSAGPRRIKLVLSVQEKAELSNSSMTPYRIRVDVTEVEGVTDHLFLFKRNPPDGLGVVWDDYIANCNQISIADYPVLDPDPLRTNPYFRLNFFDIILPSVTLAADVWNNAKKQLQYLLECMEASDDMVPLEEVVLTT